MTTEHHPKNWYDKSYKFLLLFPAIFLLFSIVYLYNFQSTHGDIFRKDVSLTGGTTITVFDTQANIADVERALIPKFPELKTRVLSDFRTGKQHGFLIETRANVEEIQPELEKFLGYELTQDNSSVEFSGSSLSQGFYLQLRSAIIAAFLLMGWVVFTIFGESRKIKGITLMLTALSFGISLPGLSAVKILSALAILCGFGLALMQKKNTKNDYYLIIASTIVSMILLFTFAESILLIPLVLILVGLYSVYSAPSIIIILCAFADIVMTITVVDLLGMNLSSAGIISFLMLIGYSVDTDILLTTRVMHTKEGTINSRLLSSFKTGIMMTLTAVGAIGVSLLITYSSSEVLTQIFTILLIGLFFDIINTWISNMSILKMYAEHQEKKSQ